MKLDDWQEEFLATEGDKILYCGRQIGKSMICGMDAGNWAIKHSKKVILMIAPTERQAYALFLKTLNYIIDKAPKMVCKGIKRPTKHQIQLTNGTEVWCLPVGLSGVGVRFLTVDRLYPEEGSRILPEVWTAVTPMLLTTGGATVILTTPAGIGTYASDVWNNKDGAFDSFTRFSKESETVIREREICATWTINKRDKALMHLARERARMGKLAYAQEYEGREMAGLKQWFPDDLIKKCMIRERGIVPDGKRYLGVDIARMGEDETVLVSGVRTEADKFLMFDMEITTKTYLTDTIRRIKDADRKYHYKRIYIDDGGVGAGVFDPLLEDSQTRTRVEAINNARRSLDRNDNPHTKRLMKEDLYSNMLQLMEKGKVELLNEDEVMLGLKSVQYEYVDGRLKIFGDYTHIAEACVRAMWCMNQKHLSIWAASKSNKW